MASIHTGELLSAYYNKKRTYKSVLARKTGIGYQTILQQRKDASMQVDDLVKISEVLGHNFFMDIAVQFPKDFTTNAPVDSAALNEIEALKEKIKQLETEKQLLLQVVGVKNQ